MKQCTWILWFRYDSSRSLYWSVFFLKILKYSKDHLYVPIDPKEHFYRSLILRHNPLKVWPAWRTWRITFTHSYTHSGSTFLPHRHIQSAMIHHNFGFSISPRDTLTTFWWVGQTTFWVPVQQKSKLSWRTAGFATFMFFFFFFFFRQW